MPSLNLCQFIGHVGADPEVRTFDNGNKIATTRIAVTERYLDRNNQQQERTEWIGIVFNGKLSDLAEKYIRKGSTIYVSGKWHNREWTDQAGNKRQNTELTVTTMQLLDKREQAAPARPAYPAQAPAPGYQQPAPAPAPGYASAPGYAPQPAYQAPPAPAPVMAPAPNTATAPATVPPAQQYAPQPQGDPYAPVPGDLPF
jgi:single-strand DNA-binding protein